MFVILEQDRGGIFCARMRSNCVWAWRSGPSGENGKVQILALTKPDDVLRVVGAIVAGVRMGEYREIAAIEHHPAGKFAELTRLHRELTAATRVWPDRPHVEMADADVEPTTRRASQGTSLLQLFGIEIDVRVEVSDSVRVLQVH